MADQDTYLKDVLTEAIAALLQDTSEDGDTPPLYRDEARREADRIARDLIHSVVGKGLPVIKLDIEGKPLSGGNTAEMVAFYKFQAPFAFKLDQKTKKLAEEAKVMQAIGNNYRLDEDYRKAWPAIYAVHDTPPYAYLMEFFPPGDGWSSLEDRLFPKPGRPVGGFPDEMILHTLDIMFRGFSSSQDRRTIPSIRADYLGRIVERLTETAEQDARFISQPLEINGEHYAPWQHYIDLIQRKADYLDRISAPFSTIVHGDPNPGNILLRKDKGTLELKFIDPKEWLTGDYLFDIAKLTHFIENTGPMEKPHDGQLFKAQYHSIDGGGATLTYRIDSAAWTPGVVALCLDRVAEFAGMHGDHLWQARYELGMAANLLGLPRDRLKKSPPREDVALGLYGEGLKWLARFCARLEEDFTISSPPVAPAAPNEVEPETLRRFRDAVRAKLPDVIETLDRRGFQLLHWPPARPNAQNKPVELSLEHEGRLRPLAEKSVQQLREALHRSSGGTAADGLLASDSRFAGLGVSRFDRAPGPQSVDLYYDDAKAASGNGLIAAGFTLRQRLMSSKFMTWGTSADASMHPLNLELPSVPYGLSAVIARLEFNWIDNLEIGIDEFLNSAETGGEDAGNPLLLASMTGLFPKTRFEPVISHTVLREKFALADPSPAAGEQEQFYINIDSITAQSLRTGHVAHHTEIDIAPCRVVDEAMLSSLIRLTEELSRLYGLVPARSTKAWADAAQLSRPV